jgi:hypothetical protein
MAEVWVQTLEAQLDIGALMDPGSMAEAVSLELGGDEIGTLPHGHMIPGSN